MPTYEYECLNCAYRFEKFQSITDKPIEKCPECSGKVKRLISSGGGIIFKGRGFYATDYRKKNPVIKNKDSCPLYKDKSCEGCKDKS